MLSVIISTEGVETEDQLIRVGIEGCSEAQGYLISEPIPARDVLGFLGLEPRVVRPEEIAPPRTAAIWRSRSESFIFDFIKLLFDKIK